MTTVYLAGFLSFHRPVGRRHNALSVGRCASLTERASEGTASLRRRWGPTRMDVSVGTIRHPAGERPGARSVRLWKLAKG